MKKKSVFKKLKPSAPALDKLTRVYCYLSFGYLPEMECENVEIYIVSGYVHEKNREKAEWSKQ